VIADYAAAESIEAVRGALVRRAGRLGFRFVALVSPAASLALHNFPLAWTEEIAGEPDVEAVCPMFEVASARTLPFFWRDPDVQAGLDARRRDILRRAAAAGIADGFTVPIRPPGAPPAAGTVVAGAARPDDLAYRAAHSEIMLAHERARTLTGGAPAPQLGLTAAERDCLALAARGKTDWEIGAILGLTQRQVHYLIERVKARAGVTTRIQAVVHAFASGELAVSEALRDPAGRG
jgi:LuxR family quorum-sensing system transcriptional regulator CciR